MIDITRDKSPVFQTGLYGESIQIHLDKPDLEWSCHTLPVNRPFSWYKVVLTLVLIKTNISFGNFVRQVSEF